jgi:hypothetical protein
MKTLLKYFVALAKNILPYFISKIFVEKRNIKRFNLLRIPQSAEPYIFNEYKEKKRTFFLKDEMYRDVPYSFVEGRSPRYIHWDRYNYGLKNHFYTHKDILQTIGAPIKQFAYFIESEAIVPEHYKILKKNKSLASEFDLIFTHSDYILDKYSNSAFLPGAGVWYGTELHGGNINPLQYEYKSKNISIISSNKQLCELHSFRINLAQKCKAERLADTFGNFDNGPQCKVSEALEKYRYSIVIENYISSYWFTEKIMNCFASMTIPIYYGASKISNYFNLDGIIILPDMRLENITNVLKNCNKSEYQSKLPAVIDNFNRVQEFLSIEDYLYKHYQNHFAK